MTHEEAQAWLTARNVFPRVTPVAEPGMWHVRMETEGYMEFVHRRTGEVVHVTLDNPTMPIPASKCTSRPDCPCDFCVRVRAEIAEGRSEKDKENQLAEDFLRSYSRRSE
jgi:hypothetical protein